MLVNTKYFSPVIMDGVPRFDKNSWEWEQYWAQEMQRCLQGYTVGGVWIPGEFYWYLNWWKIRRLNPKTGRKEYGAPRFLELDYDFFMEIHRARYEGKFMVLVKRRQCGFSEKAAALAGHEYTFFPKSQTVIVAGESKYADDTMLKCHNGLAELRNTEWKQRFSGDLSERIAQWKPKGEQEYVGNKSELHSMSAWNNAQVTIGKTPSLILFEEAGKFKNLIAAFNYIKPALVAEGNQTTGLALIWGTGGEMDTGADQLKKMFYNPAAYNCLEYDDIYSEDWNPENTVDRPKVGWFVPAWRFKVVDEDGNDLKEESVKLINEQRDEVEQSKDPKDMMNEITQNPIYSEEAFLIQGKNRFNTAKLNRRLIQIRKSKKLQEKKRTGILEWIREGGDIVGVNFIEDPNGWYYEWEKPRKINGEVPEFLYKGNTDSWDKPEVADAENASKGSCQIIKGFLTASDSSNKFVARMTMRTDDPDVFYERTAMMMVRWNAKNMIEYSNYGIFKWYKENDFEHLLRERPDVVTITMVNSKVQNKYGVDPQSKEYWLERLKHYIENNTERMDDEEQIERLIMYKEEKGYNCDITISSAISVVHLEDDNYLNLKATEEQKQKQRFTARFEVVNGRMRKIYDNESTESVGATG